MYSDTLRDAVVRTAHPCDADGHVNMRAVALATLNPMTPQDNDRRASEVAASAPDAVLLPVGARVTLAPGVVVPFADGHARSRRPWEGTSEAWGGAQLRGRGAPWASVTVRAALGWAELHRVAGLDGRGRDAAVGAAHRLAAWAIQVSADAPTPDDVAVDLLSESTSPAARDAAVGAVAGRIVDLARALADRWPSPSTWRAALAALAADEDNDAAAADLLTLATETCERDGVTVLAADAALADVLVSADNGGGREAGAAGRILAASAERVATWIRGDPDLADLAGAERSALAPGELWCTWWGGEPSGSPSTSVAVAALAVTAWRANAGEAEHLAALPVLPLDHYRKLAGLAGLTPTERPRRALERAMRRAVDGPGLPLLRLIHYVVANAHAVVWEVPAAELQARTGSRTRRDLWALLHRSNDGDAVGVASLWSAVEMRRAPGKRGGRPEVVVVMTAGAALLTMLGEREGERSAPWPSVDLAPPLVGRRQDHAAQYAAWLLMPLWLAELSSKRRGAAVARAGAWAISPDQWREMMRDAGVPERLHTEVWAAWLAGDERAPPVFALTSGGAYALSAPYHRENAYLLTGADASANASARAKDRHANRHATRR